VTSGLEAVELGATGIEMREPVVAMFALKEFEQ